MPQKGSVECWISTASGRLPEYDDPEQNEITVGKATSRTTYIESKPGEEFYIGFQVHDPWGPDLGRPLGTTDLACKIIADGVDTKYTTVCANLVESPYSIREVKDLRRTNPKGDPEMYRLVFSDMELTEDSGDLPGGLIDYKKAAQVGEIRVHVSRYKRTGADIPYKPPSTADKTVKAHEKELKGRDIKHTVKFSEGKAAGGGMAVQGHYIDHMDTPLFVFRFLYRSRHALQTLGLIPRSPSPVTEAKAEDRPKKPLEDMTTTELEEELQRRRAGNNATAGVKRERADSHAPERKKKKIMTIDLTDD